MPIKRKTPPFLTGLSLIAILQLLAVGASSERQIVGATLVDDHATQPRLEGAASALEDCEPATDLTERIVRGVTDVEPEELTAVVVRIIVERCSRDVRPNLLNCFLIHIGVEDVCGLVRRRVVGRVGNPLESAGRGLLHEGINLRVSAATRGGIGETRNLEINHVIEATIATIHTEGSNKLRRGGIADVLTKLAVVADERTARFGGGDKSEDCRTVLTTEGVVTRAIADKLNANNVKLILRKLNGRHGNSTNAVKVGVFGAVASLDLRNEAQILATAAVIENRLRKGGQLFNSLGNLGLDLEAGLEVIKADARGLVSLGLEIPVLNGLTEGQIIRDGNTSVGRSAVGGRDVRPIVLNGARKDTLNGDLVKGGSHSKGEFANTDKTAPRGFDLIALLNVNGETASFALEKAVNRTASDCHIG